MKLKSIEFKNFRIFENQKFEFKPLTVLTGPNSSGKSTLVKGLTLLQENLKAPNYLGKLAFKSGNHKLGDFESIRTRGLGKENVKFILEYDLNDRRKKNRDFEPIFSKADSLILTLNYVNHRSQLENGILTNYDLTIKRYKLRSTGEFSEDGEYEIHEKYDWENFNLFSINYSDGNFNLFIDIPQFKIPFDFFLKMEDNSINKIFSGLKTDTLHQEIEWEKDKLLEELKDKKAEINELEFDTGTLIEIKDLITKRDSLFNTSKLDKSKITHKIENLRDSLTKYEFDSNEYEDIEYEINHNIDLLKIKSEEQDEILLMVDNEIDELHDIKRQELEDFEYEKELRIDELEEIYDSKISNLSIKNLKDKIENKIFELINSQIYLLDKKIEISFKHRHNLTIGDILMSDGYGTNDLSTSIEAHFESFANVKIIDLIEKDWELDFLKQKKDIDLLKIKDLISKSTFETLRDEIIIAIIELSEKVMKNIPFISLSSNRGIQKRFYRIAKPQYHIENALSTLLSIRYSKVDNDKNELNNEKFQFIQEWALKFGIIEGGQILTAESVDGDFVKGFIADNNGKEIVNIADLGLGITQLLPIIIYTADAIGQNQLICIEEPGTHLHPDFQAKLVDFMLDANEKHQTQFLIETHSGVFLKALHYMVKDNKLTDKELLVYFTDKETKKFRSINIDAEIGLENQFIEYWEDFYDEHRLREIREYKLKDDEIEKLIKDEITIIYCENKNAIELNKLNIPNIKFYPASSKNHVYQEVVNHSNRFGLIDRDFITDEEISKIEKKQQNLMILDFYCFENYLYHPDNIKEVFSSINVDNLKNNFKDLKNNSRRKITRKLDRSRGSYEFLHSKCKMKIDIEKGGDKVIELLESDKFEDFYKVFSAKNYKDYTNHKEKLLKTEWFKTQIMSILNRNQKLKTIISSKS